MMMTTKFTVMAVAEVVEMNQRQRSAVMLVESSKIRADQRDGLRKIRAE